MVAFTSGFGEITTPEQARKRRELAESLIGRSETPGKNWAEGLSDVAAALTGTVLQREVDEAEASARQELGGLFGGLSSSSSEQDLVAALNNPWASPSQQAVAQTLLSNQFQQNDPYRQLQLAQAQLEYDRALAGDTGGTEYYGTPVPYQLEDGSIGFGQLGKDGSMKPISLPEGATPAPTTRTVDTPTESIVMDIYGNELYRIPKDNLGAAQATAVGRGLGDNSVEIINAGRNAKSNLAKLDILEQTLGNAPQGMQGAFVQAAGNIGIAMDGLDDIQAAQAIINQMVPIQRLPGSGTMSDRDLELYKASLPSIINQPGGNKKIIATMRAINEYMEKAGDIEWRLVSGKIGVDEAEREYSELKNPLENYQASTGSGVTTIPLPEDVQTLTDKWLK